MTVRAAYRVTSAFILVLSVGCGSGRTDRPAVRAEVTDSAGVRMVANPADVVPLNVEQALRIGVLDGDPDYQFDRIRTLAVDSVGGIWVLDANPSARHYGPDGVYLGSAGGQGEGPGESRGYYAVWAVNGQVILHGGMQGAQIFAPDGTLLDASPTEAGAGGMMSTPFGPNGDGWTLRRGGTTRDESGQQRQRIVLGRGSLTEPGFDTLISLTGAPVVMRSLGSGLMSMGMASHFDGAPTVAAGPDGSIVYAHAMDYRIEVYAGDGSLRQVIERAFEPVPYDPEIEAAIEPAVRRASEAISGGRASEEEIARIAASATPSTSPTHLPVIDNVLAAPDGTIWIARGDRHPRPASRSVAQAYGYARTAWIDDWIAPAVFELFTPEGEYRGTAELPGTFIPIAVTTDRVYGIETDEFDVQYVAAYEVGGAAGA